jgi:hypothetical protein
LRHHRQVMAGSSQQDGQYHAGMKRIILFECDDDWLIDSLSDDGTYPFCQLKKFKILIQSAFTFESRN